MNKFVIMNSISIFTILVSVGLILIHKVIPGLILLGLALITIYTQNFVPSIMELK